MKSDGEGEVSPLVPTSMLFYSTPLSWGGLPKPLALFDHRFNHSR